MYCFTAILSKNQTLFLRCDAEKWSVVEIEGEAKNTTSTPEQFDELLDKLERKLNLTDRLKKVALHLLYDDNQLPLLRHLSEKLAALNCEQWQVLQWKPVYTRASALKTPVKADILEDLNWLESVAMPMFENTLHYRDEVWEAEQHKKQQEHQETMETLAAQRNALEAKVSELSGQIKAMKRLNVEQLAVYFPIFYQNFWNYIKPSDLALLANTYQALTVPSPFPEPDEHTIAKMKARFSALPTEERQNFLEFCQQLPIDRKLIRPTMRSFFPQ